MTKSTITRIAISLFIATTAASAGSFDQQFETIKKTASKAQLYAFLWDVPKGGDLHNHFGLSNMAEQWYEAATDQSAAEPTIPQRHGRRNVHQLLDERTIVGHPVDHVCGYRRKLN